MMQVNFVLPPQNVIKLMVWEGTLGPISAGKLQDSTGGKYPDFQHSSDYVTIRKSKTGPNVKVHCGNGR